MNAVDKLLNEMNVATHEVVLVDAITIAIKMAEHEQCVDRAGAMYNLAPILHHYAELIEAGVWPPEVTQ